MSSGGGGEGSVMDQMLKLFEPPGGYPPERDAELHPYFKRPGRGHNHDVCDSCKEGGALICCDFCPASFHLQCHDPPLEDDDIPEGDWMCIKCFATKQEKQSGSVGKPELVVKPGKKSEKPESLVKQILKKDRELDPKPGTSEKPKGKDRDWRPKKRKTEEEEEGEEEGGRPKRATRLKKTKYNDNSTEEEFSESDFFELEPYKPPTFKRRTYMDIYAEHLRRKPRLTSNLFQHLLDAANNQSVEEFNLPKNIYVPEKFPYAWKWSTEERRNRGQPNQEFDSRGKLKMCYVCVRSSRLGPLVQCDFCPCLFHMDCLDPPLAEIPSDVWMCPNHVESLLDTRLTSSRVTERVNLWDKFATQPIDPHAVKMQFLKTCSRKKASRKARTVALTKRIKVPEYVKVQYTAPPALLPGPGYQRWKVPGPPAKPSLPHQTQRESSQELSSAVEDKEVVLPCKEDNLPTCIDESKSTKPTDSEPTDTQPTAATSATIVDEEITLPTKTEEDNNSQSSGKDESSAADEPEVEMDVSDCPKDEEGDQPPSVELSSQGEDNEDDLTGADVSSLDSDLPIIPEETEKETTEEAPAKESESAETSEDQCVNGQKELLELAEQASLQEEEDQGASEVQLPKLDLGKSAIVQKPAAPLLRPTPKLDEAEEERVDEFENYTADELEWVSSLVSLQTALLRKKMGEEDSLRCYEKLSNRMEDTSLTAGLDRSPDSSTISGFSLSGKVALDNQLIEQLQEYLITHSEVDNMDPVVVKYLAAKQMHSILPTRMSQLQSSVRVRASLTPVGSRKLPFYMQYRTLEIGTGPEINLNLKDFGHCNQLSDRHATLFYDELSGQYELVNYSRHGTRVDECVYSLDIGCVASRYKKRKGKAGSKDDVVMAGPSCSLTPCYCDTPDYTNTHEGFEGSALLHHGSRIKFGCLEFVFSVAAVQVH